MTTPNSRADDRIAAWAAATGRPIPAFVRRRSRRRGGRVAILAAVTVLLLAGIVAGTVLTGSSHRTTSLETAPSADLALTAARAIATAPGVEYELDVQVTYDSQTTGIRSFGKIDFQHGRFSGTANDGHTRTGMLLFGGPTNGAVVKADGLFVQTEGDPWVAVPEASSQLDAFMQSAHLSDAFVAALDASSIDPEIRSAKCGVATCRLVTVDLPASALFALETALFGDSVSQPPTDLGPIVVELLIDPTTGFLASLETHARAGTTPIYITLELTRLDPAPAISPPIP
jgi:hypothetical protein